MIFVLKIKMLYLKEKHITSMVEYIKGVASERERKRDPCISGIEMNLRHCVSSDVFQQRVGRHYFSARLQKRTCQLYTRHRIRGAAPGRRLRQTQRLLTGIRRG